MKNQIIWNSIKNILDVVDQQSVDLSIVYPIEDTITNQNQIKNILKKIDLVTKSDGICCFFIEDTIDSNSDKMSMNMTKIFLETMDSDTDWILDDQIIWIKKDREKFEDNNDMISFENTPFSTICILTKKNSKFESIDFREKTSLLAISKAEKDAFKNDMWHIHPKPNGEFHDRLPSELIRRLVLLFSKEYDVVLDPFCGTGITAIVSKENHRNFICIDEDPVNCEIANRRVTLNL